MVGKGERGNMQCTFPPPPFPSQLSTKYPSMCVCVYIYIYIYKEKGEGDGSSQMCREKGKTCDALFLLLLSLRNWAQSFLLYVYIYNYVNINKYIYIYIYRSFSSTIDSSRFGDKKKKFTIQLLFTCHYSSVTIHPLLFRRKENSVGSGSTVIQ